MENALPKKSLGQHWLNDPASLASICEMADLNPKDTVLEIGPGHGSLTQNLTLLANKVVAVEFDDQLAAQLPLRIRAENLTVVHEDILKYDLTKLPIDYKVVANIPYYLTSNLLRVLCESDNPPSVMVLLVQKEVAQRVCAPAGSMSMLSVSVQFYYTAELGTIVPAKLFTPPPKVDSQILKLTRHKAELFPGINTKSFFRVVKSGFANRRKTLANSLSAGLHISKAQAAEFIALAKLSVNARPQELSLTDWYNLYLAIIASDILQK